MQLTTKNCLNRIKNKGVIAGYEKYAKSVIFVNMAKNNKSMNLKNYISMCTYVLCIHIKINVNWSIGPRDIIKRCKN